MADEPDGLESLGFDPPQLAMKPRGPWWLATRSLRSSIVLVSVWAAFFLLRLIELFIGASVDWLGGILLAVSGFLVIEFPHLCISRDFVTANGLPTKASREGFSQEGRPTRQILGLSSSAPSVPTPCSLGAFCGHEVWL